MSKRDYAIIQHYEKHIQLTITSTKIIFHNMSATIYNNNLVHIHHKVWS